MPVMRVPGLRVLALCISCAIAVPAACLAQESAAPDGQIASAGSALAPQQLDQLVAPVALYPDPLLADVLAASTYPLEVVEADRWVLDPANATLRGDALAAALDAQDWDPSVKSLVAFPDVLQMLDAHLDWMESLGEAFLAQQDDVMDAVQRLRQRAQAAGNLNSNGEESVASEDGEIGISPPADMVYVPDYNPWCAFGTWPYAISPPYYFVPWPGYCEPADYAVVFGPGIGVPFAFWDWGYFDWRHHQLRIHRDRFDKFQPGRRPNGDAWHHDPSHRVGVPYGNPRNAQAFEPSPGERQSFRGYQGEAASVQASRPVPPAFESFGPGAAVRMQSERGMMSRGISTGFGRGFGGGAARGGGSPGGRGH